MGIKVCGTENGCFAIAAEVFVAALVAQPLAITLPAAIPEYFKASLRECFITTFLNF
jgi:hypothetical protein